MQDLRANFNIIRKNVKHITIKVNHDKAVNVVIPLKYPLAELDKIIKKRSAWITEKLNHIDKLRSNYFNLEKDQILYLGEKFRFIFVSELKRVVRINYDVREIYSGIDLLNKKNQLNWLKKEADTIIKAGINAINEDNRFKYNKIFIRSQKTKWGNCSNKRNIAFNWRLIKAPEFILKYLIIHELMHLEEMNHSKKYWENLSRLYPDYKEANIWLKRFGPGLFYD